MKINDLSKNGISTAESTALKVDRTGGDQSETRRLICEHRMEIFINERKVMSVVCTACDLLNLVVGRLISEGIAPDTKDIESIYICEKGLRSRVFLSEAVSLPDNSSAAEIPTCCTDNINLLPSDKELPVLNYDKAPGPEEIFKLAEYFRKDTSLHKDTSGTHSAYLMHLGDVVYSCEDIGRHNALDKAIGELHLKGYDPADCIVYTTGRVPVDMVRKAIRARLPVLVSKSVPTQDAVELARQHGLRLICRAWPDSFDSY